MNMNKYLDVNPEVAQAIAEGKLAGNRRMQPQNRFHERAFSRAVFADDAQVLAPRHGKGDVLRNNVIFISKDYVIADDLHE